MAYRQYGLLALGCLVAYWALSKLVAYIQNVRFAKAHGCKPPAKLSQPETIFGWKMTQQAKRERQEKRFLDEGVKRFEKNGETFQVTVSGMTFTTTMDPENIKAILATNFKDFGIGHRLPVFGPLFGSGIFTTDGAQWEHSRAMVRPNFTRSQVADLDTFETHIKHLIQKLPRDGSTVDLQPLFFQLTFDSATEFLFGESVNILQSPEGSVQQQFASAFDFGQQELAVRSRLGPYVWLYRNKKFDEACDIVHTFVDRFVQQALEYRRMHDQDKHAGDEKKYIFSYELAKSTQDPKQLRDEILNILLAGRDTTASLLAHTWHTLARRPDVWEKLKAEVDELGGRAPDYETLRNMKYLKYVLNESLRLYPVVPLNSRFAKQNTTLPRGGGPDGKSPVFIKKGAPVSYSVYSMHRREDIYGPDAKEFKPERWKTLRSGWGYLPFNGGPRICVGQQFALTEAGYTTVRLMQQFESCEARDARPWAEGLSLTMSVGHGVQVSLQTRKE